MHLFMHKCMQTHTHIVYSASSLPDAVANKYLLHYTHLTNRRLRCALMEYNKYKSPAETRTCTQIPLLVAWEIDLLPGVRKRAEMSLYMCARSRHSFAILHF